MRRQRGFTLVELVAVLIIVGVLSAAAISRFNPGSFDAAAAAQELLEAIRYAQERSMSNTGAAYYEVVITGSGYRVRQGGADIANPLTGVAPYASSGGGVWSHASLAPAMTIVFDGYGAPDLLARQTIAVTVGTETANVTVEAVTGLAR